MSKESEDAIGEKTARMEEQSVKGKGRLQKQSTVERERASRTLRNRLTWIFLFLCIFAGFGYHAHDLVNTYLQYQSYYAQRTNFRTLAYPDIVLCESIYVPFTRYQNERRGYQSPDTFVGRNDTDGVSYLYDVINNFAPAAWRLILKNTTDSSGETAAERNNIIQAGKQSFFDEMARSWGGPLLSDLVLACYFNGEYCGVSNFSTFYNSHRSVCHRFSPRKQNFDFGKAVTHGLSLIMSGRNLAYVDGDFTPLTKLVSLNVYVTEPGGWPSIPNPQLMMPPNRIDTITVTPTLVTNLDLPNKPCQEARTYNVCTLQYNLGRRCHPQRESVLLCEQMAVQRDLASHCGCVSYEWPIPGPLGHLDSCHQLPRDALVNRGYLGSLAAGNQSVRLLNRSVVPLGAVLDLGLPARRYRCYQARREMWSSVRREANCIRLCSYTEYTITTDRRKNDLYGNAMRNEINSMVRPELVRLKEEYDRNDLPTDHIRRSLTTKTLPLSFYFTGFTFLDVKLATAKGTQKDEERRYPVGNLFSDFGGTMGLWIGASVITVFELVEAVIKFIQSRLKKRRSQ